MSETSSINPPERSASARPTSTSNMYADAGILIELYYCRFARGKPPNGPPSSSIHRYRRPDSDHVCSIRRAYEVTKRPSGSACLSFSPALLEVVYTILETEREYVQGERGHTRAHAAGLTNSLSDSEAVEKRCAAFLKTKKTSLSHEVSKLLGE